MPNKSSVFAAPGVAFAIFSLFGCVTGKKMHQVSPILGKPDGFRSANGYEWFQYSHRLATGWAWDRADYNDFFQEFCAFELEQIIERSKRGIAACWVAHNLL